MPETVTGRNGVDYAAEVGKRMARLGKGWIGVGHLPGESFGRWAAAALEGACSAGADVLELGEMPRPIFQFALAAADCRGGLYVGGNSRPVLQTVGEQGLPLTRQEEMLMWPTATSKQDALRGRREKADGMWELYCSRLKQMAGGNLRNSRCILRCGDAALQRQVREVLSGLGCQLLDGPVLWLNNTGERLTAFTPEGELIPYAHLVEKACSLCFAKGVTVALPEGTAPGAESMGKVLRYSLRPSNLDSKQAAARRLAARQLWERDGIMLAVMLLAAQQQGSLELPRGRLWHGRATTGPGNS